METPLLSFVLSASEKAFNANIARVVDNMESDLRSLKESAFLSIYSDYLEPILKELSPFQEIVDLYYLEKPALAEQRIVDAITKELNENVSEGDRRPRINIIIGIGEAFRREKFKRFIYLWMAERNVV